MKFLNLLKIHRKILSYSCLVVAMSFLIIQNSYSEPANPSARDAYAIGNRLPDARIENKLDRFDIYRMRNSNDNIDSSDPDGDAYGDLMKRKKGLYHCAVDKLKFGAGFGQDTKWEIWPISSPANPACTAYIASNYVASKIADKARDAICRNVAASKLVDASEALGMPFSPAKAAAMVAASGTCAAMEPGPTKVACCSSLAASVAKHGVAQGVLGAMYDAALDAQLYARICGRNWETWSQSEINPKVFVKGKYGHWVDANNNKTDNPPRYNYKYYNGSYAKYLEDKFKLGKIEECRPGDRCNTGNRPFSFANLFNRVTSLFTKKSLIANPEFRELIFGGIEYSPEERQVEGRICKNPWLDDKKFMRKTLGYEDEYQKYYMRGSGVASNYACERFIVRDDAKKRAEGKAAYDCCIEKSKNSICIENATSFLGYRYKFCELGKKCRVNGVAFITKPAKTKLNFICAETFSACPFNHLLGGGTEEYDDDNDKNRDGHHDSHCQYLKHCVEIPKEPYNPDPKLSSPFISKSCKDLKGDSQNVYGFENEFGVVGNRNFSAPMAQCFHETLYNIFLDKAGHIKCKVPGEVPNEDGKCEGGEEFIEGDQIAGASFFEIIQSYLTLIVKLVLTFAVMGIGYTILMGGQMIARKDISMFVVKLALVVYFALGSAWQQQFFEGVYKASTILSNIFINIDLPSNKIKAIQKTNPVGIVLDDVSYIEEGGNIRVIGVPEISELNNRILKVNSIDSSTKVITLKTLATSELDPQNIDGTNFVDYRGNGGVPIEIKLDGCQFPKFDYSDENDETRFNNPRYPPGKEYLAIWDTLDCKIVNALGLIPGATVPTLFLTILGGLLTFGFGILFAFGALIFVFYLISITVRALHMFLISTIAIVILIYVSPIMITLVLFKRTSSIFKKWWSNLLGFVLQPVILFAYLGILITIFNQVIIGDLYYQGEGHENPKVPLCKESPGGKDSLYCISQELHLKSNPIVALGWQIPALAVMEIGRVEKSDPVNEEIEKAEDELKGNFNRVGEILFTMIKAAFLMFIFSQFFEKIATLASVLVGSASVSSISGGVVGARTQTKSVAALEGTIKTMRGIRGFQKRAVRGGFKAGKKVTGLDPRSDDKGASLKKGLVARAAGKVGKAIDPRYSKK